MTSPLLGSIASQVHVGLRGFLYAITLSTRTEYRATVHSVAPGSPDVLAFTSAELAPAPADAFGYGDQQYALGSGATVPGGATYAHEVTPAVTGVLVAGAQLSLARGVTYTGAKGYDEQRRRDFRRGDRVIVTDWYALLLRPSLPAGVTPLPDASKILCRDGRTRTVIAVKSDPAAATWELWLA